VSGPDRPRPEKPSPAALHGAVGGRLVRVAVGRPVRGDFTYRLPPAQDNGLTEGRRLLVPFGRARAVGFYLGDAHDAPPTRLRDVVAVLDEDTVFPADLFGLLAWTAEYYRHPLGEALRSALPPGLAQPQEAPPPRASLLEIVTLTERAATEGRPRGVAMGAVLDYLAAVGRPVDIEELSAAIPGARDPVKRLIARGLCEVRAEPRRREHPETILAGKNEVTPTLEQERALAAIAEALEEGAFAPFLLHGVTGSGKTEVYLRAIERTLALGRGALVLVPEIALTPQLVGRFRARFGEKVAVLHSGLKDTERLAEWRRLRSGESMLAVGVRSAIFAPVASLGLLVVDEEHDPSFKQEEKLRYHARDLAVVRAKQAGCPVLLGSATPSLETLHNARAGRYRLLRLERRVDDRPLPEVSVVDLRLAGRGHVSAAFPQLAARKKLAAAEAERVERASGLSPKPPEPEEDPEDPRGPPLLSDELCAAMEEVLDHGRQTILFLNRRGHSTYHLCLGCGESLRCVNCAVSLTLHAEGGRGGSLMCHYCGHRARLPDVCPSCSGPIERLGMGTERVEEEVQRRFPRARLCRLDRDSARGAEELTALLASFARGDKDVLIGTQMVAKGHDFPGVTLVGVILADLALNLPDFRAAERTFQLLTQVAGRAGRGADKGRVVVQTFNPEAEAISFVLGHDYDGFSAHELKARRAFGYPPFCRLLSVRIEGRHPSATAQGAQQLAQAAAVVVRASGGALRLLGPAPSPLARLRGKTRWQMLIKGPTSRSLHGVADATERAMPSLPSGVRAVVDVDPIGLL
jgi:primosomal protein N' (replication factor Y)